ncbi:hypothetical protein BFP72_15325 [Reichenbachiella sp. 5M10]|uniref:lysylphosphatidylglycerol synthase transmembrane domain-containing protein n=1 Tax=Reichenbachiella sp. 5M10 TaxID=1889772 RepID=UPI000C5E558E|nr:lysylphosphatidylglycerol synthase transmembrane domain-containing protein [Reichenbachiella sp. 5M10]PIB36676.1 hypothetical protein BFP72_15325 [Reichenbachiella sp. 5M10]
MKLKISTVLKFCVSLILAALLFYFVFRNISFAEFADKLDDINYWWIGLSVLLSIVSHLLRSYRWNLTLQPLGYELSIGRTFLALMSGYLANLVFPRLGEVTRCGVLKRIDGVPISVGIGSVITERVIDFLILLSLIALDFVLEFDKIFEYFVTSVKMEDWLANRTLIFAGIGLLVVGGIVGVLGLRYVLKYEFKNPTLNKVKEKLLEIVDGLGSIRKVQSPTGYVLSTIGIWVLYYLMSYVIFFSMTETSELTVGAGLSILAAAGVSMAMPVQGGIGAYHALVSGVLVIYGVGATTGLFFATMLHTSQMLMIVVVGGASMLGSLFIRRENKTESTTNS